ncbi:MAG: chromate transporter [Clostridia bacterium]|nr:chromate transporter [Clostridia bacterium]
MKLKKLVSLFLTFAKIGAFTFGGGYAMIPLIQREAVTKNGWVSDDDIMDIIAIAESTPGPVAINSATFVGYKTAGVLGSAAATLGVVMPSFIVIYLISGVLREFQEIKVIKYAFAGIRAGVIALICKALMNMYKKAPKGLVGYILMGAAFILAAFVKINAVYIIIAAAVVGIVSAIIAERRKNDLS